jgi:hypothetical protein
MGKHIERVPPSFAHPIDADGRAMPGAHKRALRKIPDADRTAFMVYEDTSEGTPLSPVLISHDALREWLLAQGHSEKAVDHFMIVGAASSLFFKDGQPVDGIEALAMLSRDAALDIAEEQRARKLKSRKKQS